MSLRWFCIGSLLLVGVAMGEVLHAAEKQPSPAKPPKPDPRVAKAQQAIDTMLATYRNAKSYMDNAVYREVFVVRDTGLEHEAPPHEVGVLLVRPNKCRLIRRIPTTDVAGLDVGLACNGKVLRAFVSDYAGQVVEQPAPEILSSTSFDADPLLRQQLLPVPLCNIYPQLALLLATDADPAWASQSEQVIPLPDSEVDGRRCYTIRTESPDGSRVLWIDQELHTLLRLELPSAEARKLRDPEGKLKDYQLRIDFVDVAIDTELPEVAFELAVPADAKVAAVLTPLAAPAEKPAAEQGSGEKSPAGGAVPAPGKN